MDTQKAKNEIVNDLFNKYFYTVDDISTLANPLTISEFIELFGQLSPVEIDLHDINILCTENSIERKKIGQDYYLLISAK